MGRLDQALVLLLGQVLLRLAEHLPLELEILHLAVLPPHASEKLVHRRQHGVHRDGAVAGLGQRRFPLHGQLLGHGPAIRPLRKAGQGTEVGLDSALLPLVVAQVVLELVEFPLGQLHFLFHGSSSNADICIIVAVTGGFGSIDLQLVPLRLTVSVQRLHVVVMQLQ